MNDIKKNDKIFIYWEIYTQKNSFVKYFLLKEKNIPSFFT